MSFCDLRSPLSLQASVGYRRICNITLLSNLFVSVRLASCRSPSTNDLFGGPLPVCFGEDPADDDNNDGGEDPADDDNNDDGEDPADDDNNDDGEDPADDDNNDDGEDPADDDNNDDGEDPAGDENTDDGNNNGDDPTLSLRATRDRLVQRYFSGY